jgi:hypothetical protein
MIWPIFIPSKGRAGTQKTATLLSESNVQFKFVVEPNEAAAYSQIGRIIELPENGMGLAYSRNFTLNHARQNSIKWFWMLDDDVNGFYKSNGKKNSRCSAAEALLEAQMILSGIPRIGQGALEYQQYSWSAKNQLKLNSYCDVAVCINTEKTKQCTFRKEVGLKEDRDFTLQVLSSGALTARASQIAFSAPKNGSNKGGLHDIYTKQNWEKSCSQKMEQIWGAKICTAIQKPDGRHDVKINWSHFSK